MNLKNAKSDKTVKKAKNFLLCGGELLKFTQSSERDFRLVLRLPVYRPWSPGQFAMVRWGAHVVGRPFAIVDWVPKKNHSELHLWVRRLGSGTEELFQLATEMATMAGNKKCSHSFSLTLPLGQGLDKKVLTSPTPLLFVSGGVGAASLIPIFKARQKLQSLKGKDLWVHGEKNKNSLDRFFTKEQKPGEIYLEDTKKRAARVTAFFETEANLNKFSHVLACGPTPMLRALKNIEDKAADMPELWLGLEEKMACGIGLCFSCSVPTLTEPERCCLKGPWFRSSEIAASWCAP